jgi:hypothetical protein
MRRRRGRTARPVQPPEGGTVSRLKAFESAVAWCAVHGGSTSDGPTLRSPALRPPDDPPGSLNSEYLSWLAAGVASVVTRRLDWVRGQATIDHTVTESVVGGAALLYVPERSACSGVAHAVTGGYFGHDDEPPWDTWAFMMGVRRRRGVISQFLLGPYPPCGVLVAWVPPPLLGIVTEGVEDTVGGTLILVPRTEAEPLGEFVGRIARDAPEALRASPGVFGP